MKKRSTKNPPLPEGKVFRLACCDCGLVHDFVLVPEGDLIGIAAKRNNRATAQRRRHRAKLNDDAMSMTYKKNLTLTRADLRDCDKDLPIEKIGGANVKGPIDRIRRASIVTFVDGDRRKKLKNRHGTLDE